MQKQYFGAPGLVAGWGALPMATVRDFDIVFLEKVLIEGDITKTI